MKTNIYYTLLIICSALQAQENFTLSGYVRDSESGENLIGATVYDQRTQSGVITNTFGFFSLTLPQDSVVLSVSYVGYEKMDEILFLDGDQNRNFTLIFSNILDEVVISGVEDYEMMPSMSTVRLSMKQVSNMPVLMGEADIMKSIQLLPGIAGGAEGSSNIYVRGGGPDQNLTLLDGVPVYNPTHLFGFFSVFNPDAINNVEVIKGGFPARYAGRLSSVIDISMKEGNNQHFAGSATVGLISAKFSIEGPIIKEKTSFILSGRRSYIDAFYNPFERFGNANDISNDYYFHDFNAKINHIFSDRSRLYLSFYTGLDNFDANEMYRSPSDSSGYTYREDKINSMRWGNMLSIMRWNFVANPKLFFNTSVSTNAFHFRTQRGIHTTETNAGSVTKSTDEIVYRNHIRDYTVRMDVDYLPSPNHSLKAGIIGIAHDYAPGVSRIEVNYSYSSSIQGTDNLSSNEFGAYIEDDIQIGRAIRFNLGIHQSLFLVEGVTYSRTQPRISARYLVREGLSLKSSYAEMQQYNHLLSNSGIGMPTDLWVPATSTIKPQNSQQLALGVNGKLRGVELSLEGFSKHMTNLIEYQDGATYSGIYTPWYDKVTVGKGRSNGLEFLVRKNNGKLTGWIGYTLSKTERQFSELNDGRWFPFKYDRRHDISIVTNYNLPKSWTLGAVWVYASGNHGTLPVSTFNAQLFDPFVSYNTYIYSDRNAYQFVSYHRLDLVLKKKIVMKQTSHSITIGAYNLYNRENAFYYEKVELPNHKIELRFEPRTLLPLTPFITYTIKLK